MSNTYPRKPRVWFPDTDNDGNVRMVEIDPNASKYVRLQDYEEIAALLEAERKSPDTAFNARESARYMMIETRLRREVDEASGFVTVDKGHKCECPRCLFVYKVQDILNSEPPIGEGFVSEKGLDPHTVPFPALVAEVYPFNVPQEFVNGQKA
jgi:hypothetical protein